MEETAKDAARTSDSSAGSVVGTIVYLLLGPILWSLHFGLLYGFQSIACAISGDGSTALLVQVWIAVVTALVALALLGCLAFPRRVEQALSADAWDDEQLRFQRRAMMLLAGLSLFGVIAAASAAVVLDACAR